MRSRTPLARSLSLGLLACLLAAGPALAIDPPRPSSYREVGGGDGGRSLHPQHTSGDEPGWLAPPETSLGRLARERRSAETSYAVSPGVAYSAWTQTDGRGPIRAHLLTIDLDTPGVGLDYADPGSVRRVASVPDILARDGAVAGVNGDFYDIGRTGAPLGLGKDRQRGLLHGRASGWNAAFYLDRAGRPQIGDLPIHFRVRGHPGIEVTNLNSPFVTRGGIGVYTKGWGERVGYAATEGQRRHLRVVWVRNGRVQRVRTSLARRHPIEGRVLVGRGAGADQLRGLRRGMAVRVTATVAGRPRMAITGNRTLIDDGTVTVVDNREMHPRTAVGIDRDTHQVLLLVVDGRSKASRGYTMVELATLMADLGADEALNLDGGGSSTMVARTSGANRVVNTPSDGFLRHVSNALEVTYRP